MKKAILLYGSLFAGVNIALTLIAYALGSDWLSSYTIGGLSLVASGVLILMAGISVRKEGGGFISLKDAFMAMFLAMVLGSTVQLGFNILLYNVIDPELPAEITEQVAEKTYDMLVGFNLPDEQIDEAMAEFDEMEEQFSIGGLVSGTIWYWIVVGALIFIPALIMKKEKPVIETTDS